MHSIALLALLAAGQAPDLDAIRALPDAQARVEALVRVLPELPEPALGEAYQLGYEEFLAAVEAYRGDLAVPLIEALHARARASWTAINLGMIETRTGDGPRAAEVLREAAVAAEDPTAERELLNQLGQCLLAQGLSEDGLGALGSAFCRGSENAGVVLGALALGEGRQAHARAIFRTLLTHDPLPAWAPRGWGLTLLPAPPGAP